MPERRPSLSARNLPRTTHHSDAAAALVLDHVQTSFFFGRACPAAGAIVFAFADGAGAQPAADARVALVVERIVGNVVIGDELPHVLLGPVQERVYLDEAELGVPLHQRRPGAVLRLVLADGTDPRLVALHRPAQGQVLAIEAALIGIDAVERPAVLLFVLR